LKYRYEEHKWRNHYGAWSPEEKKKCLIAKEEERKLIDRERVWSPEEEELPEKKKASRMFAREEAWSPEKEKKEKKRKKKENDLETRRMKINSKSSEIVKRLGELGIEIKVWRTFL
jgi:hypothetical protein